MQITALKAQHKNPSRVSVYVDGAYSFSLTQDQVLEHKIRTGQELDAAQLASLQKASEFGKAYARILNFIAIRPRSLKEVADYCRRKGIESEYCQTITEKLSARGYLDDAAFARLWIEHRRLGKPSSTRKLQLELRQKGVSDTIIYEALHTSTYRESNALRELIAKKRRLSRYQDDQKLMQYLVRQGFGYDEVRKVLSDSESSRED